MEEESEDLTNMNWPEQKPIRPDLDIGEDYLKFERGWIQENMHDRRNQKGTGINAS